MVDRESKRLEKEKRNREE